MKKLTLILTIVLALGLVLGLSVTAAAAEPMKVSVATAAELMDAVNYATEDLEITLTADLTDACDLYIPEDLSITVTGKEYVMTDVTVYGTGSLEITVKEILGEDTDAIYASEGVTLKVTADLSVGEDGSALEVRGNASVTLVGNIKEKTLTLEQDGLPAAIQAGENAVVNVTGNVTGNSAVCTAPENTYADGADAIAVDGNAKVTVKGDVKAGSSNGDWAYAGKGIDVYTGAPTVKVYGNVTGGDVSDPYGMDIYAYGVGIFVSESYEGARIYVSGNVTGGKATGEGAEAGYGIILYEVGASEIVVDGNVTGEGCGIYTEYSRNVDVTVKGTVSGGKAPLFFRHEGVPTALLELTWEAYQEAYPNETIASYFQFLDFFLYMINAEDYITEEDYNGFQKVYLGVYANLVGMTVPEDYPDMDNADAFLDELDAALEAKYGDDTDALCADLEESYEDVYECYKVLALKAVEKEISLLDDAIQINLTVWKLEAADGVYSLINGISLDDNDPFLKNVSYFVRVADAENGTVSVSTDATKAGKTAVIVANPENGYKVNSFSVSGGELVGKNWSRTFTAAVGGGILAEVVFVSEDYVEGSDSTEGTTPSDPSGNPPTSDGNTAVLVSLVVLTSVAGFCLFNLARIRRQEQ